MALADPQLAAFVHMMMPKEIEIQRYLTKPVSFSGSGDANGIEVILAARDSFGDPTKIIGTFQFELCARRVASSDRLGRRVALWPVEINSDQTLLKYWDRLSRFYKFPLQLDQPVLPPGDYILTARLRSAGGDETLFDEYAFTHGGGGKAPAGPGS